MGLQKVELISFRFLRYDLIYGFNSRQYTAWLCAACEDDTISWTTLLQTRIISIINSPVPLIHSCISALLTLLSLVVLTFVHPVTLKAILVQTAGHVLYSLNSISHV